MTLENIIYNISQFLKPKQYKKYYWSTIIHILIEYYSPIYISLYNIFREYFKACTVYRLPKFVWHFNSNCGWQHYCGWWRILNIECFPVGWKWTSDEIRFEHCPRIVVSVFGNSFAAELILQSPVKARGRNYPDDDLYWEAMLAYLYKYNKDIKKTKENWGWQCNICNKQGIAHWTTTWNNNILTKNGRNNFQCN